MLYTCSWYTLLVPLFVYENRSVWRYLLLSSVIFYVVWFMPYFSRYFIISGFLFISSLASSRYRTALVLRHFYPVRIRIISLILHVHYWTCKICKQSCEIVLRAVLLLIDTTNSISTSVSLNLYGIILTIMEFPYSPPASHKSDEELAGTQPSLLFPIPSPPCWLILNSPFRLRFTRMVNVTRWKSANLFIDSHNEKL